MTTHQPRKRIQPFVPVGPGERTEIYSNKDLCALTSTDPRNELDELSEPNRFNKDLMKSGSTCEVVAKLPMGRLLLTFLAGAAAGGILAAFAAPKTGSELRGDLKSLVRQRNGIAEEFADQAGRAEAI